MPINQIRSWAIYQGPLRKAVHGLKYHRNLALGDYFAPALIEVFLAQKWDIDLIIPVPLSPNRRRQRGYNQAEILATPLALAIQKPLASRALIKRRETPSQVGQSASERQENIRDAFIAYPRSVSSHRILLIDDVITTGATMSACAEALLKAGASAVFGLTLARALPHADDQV
ncbi:MAG: ComF family protein [Thermanaerothrix sp.]|nr:ComF family protein [Thermanaerothrix sp.]